MAVNAANLVNFGSGGAAVGDWTYSLYALSAPSYLPLTNDTASYLTSSYPALGAIFAPTTVAYSAANTTIPYSAASSVPYKYVFGNNIFMGWNSNGNIITSADTVNWTPSAINTDYIQKAAYSGGSGVQATIAIPIVYPWQGMAYGNGVFVGIRNAPVFYANNSSVLENNSIGATAVSADNGKTWVQGTLPQYSTNMKIYWKSIGFGGGRFVASGMTDYSGANFYEALSWSYDGIEWTIPTYYAQAGSGANLSFINTIAYGGGVYVSLGSDDPSNVGWYTSGTSSLNWLPSTLPTSQKWKSVAYGAGVFVAVGSATSNGNTTAAASSTNGSSWTATTLPASLNWTSVTYANGYFVAVAALAGANALATSVDGTTWTLRAVPVVSGNRDGIAGGNGKFVFANAVSEATAGVVSLNTASSSFSLPMPPPMRGVTPYIKAT